MNEFCLTKEKWYGIKFKAPSLEGIQPKIITGSEVKWLDL